MEHRLMQPASREQIVAIIRQRAERNRDHLPPFGIGLAPGEGEPFPPPNPGGPFNDFNFGMPAGRPPVFRQAALPLDDERPRTRNLVLDGDLLSFSPSEDQAGLPLLGLYIAGKPLSDALNYFEIEILEKNVGRERPTIFIGLCSRRSTLDMNPGWQADSIGYNCCNGTLYRYNGKLNGEPYGPRSDVGDRIGCGIKMVAPSKKCALYPHMAQVFFTKNGKEIGPPHVMPIPPGGLYPTIGLHQFGEEVQIRGPMRWTEEDIMMLVDSGEEEWQRLHDIRMNGQVLEYIGRGKSLVDVGLAQAKTPIGTRNHYFELEIVDPVSRD